MISCARVSSARATFSAESLSAGWRVSRGTLGDWLGDKAVRRGKRLDGAAPHSVSSGTAVGGQSSGEGAARPAAGGGCVVGAGVAAGGSGAGDGCGIRTALRARGGPRSPIRGRITKLVLEAKLGADGWPKLVLLGSETRVEGVDSPGTPSVPCLD